MSLWWVVSFLIGLALAYFIYTILSVLGYPYSYIAIFGYFIVVSVIYVRYADLHQAFSNKTDGFVVGLYGL